MQTTARAFGQALLPFFLKRKNQDAPAEERTLLKHRAQQAAQRWVLSTKDVQPFKAAYAGIYSFAVNTFVRFTLSAQRELGLNIVEAIYLRRGGGRDELVLGASDLDFFIVLHTVSASQEMRFLKRFWARYSFYRNLLPFLGETLMGDRNELEDWLQTGCLRAFETEHSWKLLHGRDVLKELPRPAELDPRDVFSEALKCYWSLIQPVLKLQSEELEKDITPYSKQAVLLRHGMKAAIDLFRLHHCLGKSREEALAISALSRLELIDKLPKETYGDFLPRFRNLLSLRSPMFGDLPLKHLLETVYQAYRCLDDIAGRLDGATNEQLISDNKLIYHSLKAVRDPYSLSVRELFAERILFRHAHLMSSCVLSEATAQMYFRLRNVPRLAEFEELLTDLRNVSFSLERFNVPMPLSERAFRQMEKTSLLDSPFHSFYSHREEFADESGEIRARDYPTPVPDIPLSMLRKTFSELSFAMRMQPAPEQFDHFVEKVFTIVLALRIALEKGEIVTSFRATLDSFASRYPTRHDVLQRQIGSFIQMESGEEKELWEKVNGLVGEFQQKNPLRAAAITRGLSSLRASQPWQEGSETRTTDLWINLTPFLRMEMNAMKDRLFPNRPVLKL